MSRKLIARARRAICLLLVSLGRLDQSQALAALDVLDVLEEIEAALDP